MAHSPLFVIIAIVIALMTIGRAMSLLYGDINALPEGVFMGIAVIGIRLCYAAKDNKKMAGALRAASITSFLRAFGCPPFIKMLMRYH